VRYRRYSKTRTQGRDIQKGRIARKIYSEMDGQTRDITKNIGEDWRGIGDGGKESN